MTNPEQQFTKAQKLPFTYTDLHPCMRGKVENLSNQLRQLYRSRVLPVWFRPFEGYRTTARQTALADQGNGVTHARAWQSAHNLGMAVDFVPFLITDPKDLEDLPEGTTVEHFGRWSWDTPAPWSSLAKLAKDHGLTVPLPTWDPGHVQAPEWDELRRAYGYFT